MYLMVDNYDSFVHNLATYIGELDCDIRLVRNDRLDLGELEKLTACESLDGLLISPGPKSPDDCGLCKQAIALVEGRVPILGVCLGHQVIASFYGAAVEKGTRPMHGKVTPIRNDGTGLFEGLPQRFDVTRYHSLAVRADAGFPHGTLRVDAWSDDGAVMAISHRSLPVYGVQFHPEAVLTEHGHELLGNFVRICRSWKSGIWEPVEEARGDCAPVGAPAESGLEMAA